MTRILITGAAGYLGSKLLERLSHRRDLELLATDVRAAAADPASGSGSAVLDLRDAGQVSATVERFRPEIVVHLAAVVDPKAPRQLAYEVDVEGTRRLLAACLESGVRRLVVTSSGAAYGYLPRHESWLDEETPLGADEAFAYAWHKRLGEQMLAEARRRHPGLEQVVLRSATVLGAGVSTPVTRLFEGRVILGVRGGDDRFVFIWDEDVAAALEYALDGPAGVYNLAGDGALGLGEIARRLGARLLPLPATPLGWAITVGRRLGLTGHGPEQVRFLQYRPVLSNRRLKESFGFEPSKTSAEAFEIYAAGRKT